MHLEESDGYLVERPAGERGDKWRLRSMSWGSERERGTGSFDEGDGSSQYGYLGSPGGISGFSSPSGRSGSRYGGASSPIPVTPSVYNSHHARSPRTPNRQQDGSNRLGPMSPRSPSQIIYEYRDHMA